MPVGSNTTAGLGDAAGEPPACVVPDGFGSAVLDGLGRVVADGLGDVGLGPHAPSTIVAIAATARRPMAVERDRDTRGC
jgi:hypothetical protein